MKNLIKIIVVLLFTVQVNSQNFNDLDSLFITIEYKIKNREFEDAQILIDSVRVISSSEISRLKIDFLQSKIFIENSSDEKSLEILLQGFTELKKHKDIPLYTKYAREIGQIFGRSKNYHRALEYFNLALQSAIIRNDSLELSTVYFNLGSTFQMKNNLDSASYFYDNVIRLQPKHLKNKNTLATTYNNLMSLAIRDFDFDLAEKYGKESLKIHALGNDTLKMAGVLNNLGGISMYKKDLKKSNKYSFEAIKLLEKRKNIKARDIKAIALDNISQVSYLQENYKEAYDFLFESTEIRYNIVAENLESRVTEIEAKYNIAKEGEQTKIEENKRQRVEFWLYVSGFASIMLSGFMWFNYRDGRLKRKHLRLQHEQEKLIDERKIERIQNEVQIRVLNATIDAKEAERKYIAEILHDSVSTLLSSANLHLYAVKIKLKNNVPVEINKTENIISEAADKIRNLSHKLISPVLLKFGLKSAIEDLCDKYSNSQLTFNCSFKNISRYEEIFEIKIHNIIEELTNNILKHSNANFASIEIKHIEKELIIKIIDNGIGFDITTINQKDGLGLSQIIARIKIMKGKFDIESSKEKGTHIFISIPTSDKD
ncbi:MAG: ATP-binding protein [Flavobacteriaceae bacterium]|nr:ATP-binding protein [Flavobacteriaceae bacterium]